MDLRQSKRYRLVASAKFSWERSNGYMVQGEGYTRDISTAGVFVLTGEQLQPGTVVRLEVCFPSLRAQQRQGPCLRTVGHVVRSEELGFAAAADADFRMEVSKALSSQRSTGKGTGHGDKHDASTNGTDTKQCSLISRFSM
jgi:hypothetical protein